MASPAGQPAGALLPSLLAQWSLCPAVGAHPHWQEALPPGWPAADVPAARLLRFQSARLLAQIPPWGDGDRATFATHPLLPIALAPQPLWDRLLTHAGLVLLGPGLRRLIRKDQVQQVVAALGGEALAFVRSPVAQALAPRDGLPLEGAALPTQVRSLGQACLHAALRTAPAPLQARMALRLPPADAAFALPPDTVPGGDATRWLRSLLDHLDPAWLSSFPDPR